jgi:Arc/MetJ-type ribon-helix-helix transcriptional regulator
MAQPVNVRLPDRILRWLDQQAGDTSTRSQVIRSLLDDAIKQQADPAPAKGRR